MQNALVLCKTSSGKAVKKVESVLNDNRIVGSFDTLLKMRDEKVSDIGDCLMDQWSGKVVKDKRGVPCKKTGSRFSGVHNQISTGCLIPSSQAVSYKTFFSKNTIFMNY